MIVATCANIAALLASASGGETFRLTGTCSLITISRAYTSRVIVEADGSTVKGLRVVKGGNLTWRGGTIQAAGGANGVASQGYGVLVSSSANVTIENAKLTAAKKAIVLDHASRVVIVNNLFDRVGEDGIIANASSSINIISNRFQNTAPQPTVCTFLNGNVTGLSLRDCSGRGGIWTDGYHPDAVQMRNGMNGVLIAYNMVTGATQGLTQMDADSDAPIRNIAIEHNTVAVNFGHAITVYENCINCKIRWNGVARGSGSVFKAAIRPGAAFACGNTVQDVKDGTAPCPSS